MPQPKDETNGFEKYQMLIMSELAELKAGQKEIQKDLKDAQIELALIKQKAGFWGAVSGTVTSSIALAVAYFKSGGKP